VLVLWLRQELPTQTNRTLERGATESFGPCAISTFPFNGSMVGQSDAPARLKK